MRLLERESQQGMLEAGLEEVKRGRGRIVLVSGEAGIGKTSLVSSFVNKHRPDARVLWGASDPLFTPRPLGPLYDIALATLPELAEMLNAGASWFSISAALLAILQKGATPSLLVLEDIHWADEATLELIQFLGRRVQQSHALLILTYRDDEVARQHLLRSVLGNLPPAQTIRLPLAPLSEPAVNALAREAGRSTVGVYTATRGNPFFVTEVLKDESGRVPTTVRDAVLTRVARLSPPVRAILEFISVSPSPVELELIESTLHPDASYLDACFEGGFLVLSGRAVTFRHELARLVVSESLAPGHSQELHNRMLQAILARGALGPALALVVHHAMRAANGPAVLEYAPRAAQQADAQGAHREASQYYEAALQYTNLMQPQQHATLLDYLSFEYYLTGKIDPAIRVRQEAISIWRDIGPAERVGDDLRWLSRLYWFRGNRREAEDYAEQAIDLLEPLTPGLELAMAYSNRSQLLLLLEDTEAAKEWGTRALELANRINATDIAVHAQINMTTAELMEGRPGGRPGLERALAEARAHEMHDHVARSYANLSSMTVRNHEYAMADSYLREGIAYTTDRDMDSYSVYLLGWRARSLFEQGQWAQATAEAERALALQPGSAVIALPATIALGHLRAREGRPEAAELLDRARDLALPTGELQRIGPMAIARAEAAWWAGDPQRTLAEASAAYEMAQHAREEWVLGALAYWMWRAGGQVTMSERIPPAYRLMMEGDWRSAALEWERLACPFERAQALAEGDAEAQLTALSIWDGLGARPAASALREKMRRKGVKSIPRGPRPVTRANPEGLTAREMQVLDLISEGLSNAEIARRLSVSAKTVDHHVSAILAKLNVRSRTQAASIARKRRSPQD